MSDAVSILPTLADPPRRDRRIWVTAAVSAALHLLLLGFILLPRIQPPEPTEPQSVNVELVPPSEVSSLPPPLSSEAPSSLPPPASSDAAASSAEPPSSAEPASSEPASSAAPSSEASQSSAAASSEPSSAAAPVPQARPVVIPVGPSEASSDPASSVEDESASQSEASSEASDAASSDASGASAPDAESSLLTADTPDANGDLEQLSSEPAGAPDADAATDGPPPPAGALHSAKRFYLEDMLSAPAMAAARKALKTLPPEKRLAQTCNIEAIAQIGSAGKGYEPDALVASAFAKPAIAGTTYSVGNGAFRSKQKWVAVAYDCTLSKKLDAVTSFTFRLGSDVTDAMVARFGTPKPGG